MKRWTVLFSILLVMAVTALGCVGGATPAPTAIPEPAAPTATSAPAVTSAEEVMIGAIHPLTGGLARDGAFLKNGIDMAVEEINAAGGIESLNGANLVVQHADSQGQPEVGQSEAERLIQEGASALIGSYQSSVTLNATQVAEREHVPFLIDVAVSNAITERGFEYTFRFQPNQTGMTRGAVEGLEALREATGEELKTAVVLHEDSIFGTGFADIFTEMAPDYGIEVTGDIAYSLSGLTDLTTELTRVQALHPDVLMAAGYLNDGILLIRTAEELNLDVKGIFGLAHGAFSTPQFIEEVGADTANYILDANYHYDATNPQALEVRSRYKEKFGEEMPTHAVMAYQAVYILADAIERAGSTDPQAIRDALAATNYADHILPYAGPIQFDERGENPNARAIVMQILDGQILQVLPPDVAEADPVYPMPAWDAR
jgi:branched-chain amino acid transport system substrate-binding protein